METSFPSKLPEYAQFGKPIVILGPEYCSAIHWGREGDRAVCVSDQNPSVLVASLEKLNQDLTLREYYASNARIAEEQQFNPRILQQQFIDAIAQCV